MPTIFRPCSIAALVSIFLIPLSSATAENNILFSIPPLIAKIHSCNYTPLPDTGVSLCYDDQGWGETITCPQPGHNLYGQDAQYNPSSQQLSYTDNGDGTITDNLTGLMWMKTRLKRAEWLEAVTACRNLAPPDTSAAGYSDWRLPEIRELVSITDFSRYGKTIDNIFSASGDALHWSNTNSTRGGAWASGLNTGDTDNWGRGQNLSVRCVRGKKYTLPDKNRFKIIGNVVKDRATGLMWMRSIDSIGRKWKDALKFCEDLSPPNDMAAGYSDWRLPNIKELESLVDYQTQTFLRIYPAFTTSDITYNYTWSSTPFTGDSRDASPLDDPPNAYVLDFLYGNILILNFLGGNLVRCVRGGPE